MFEVWSKMSTLEVRVGGQIESKVEFTVRVRVGGVVIEARGVGSRCGELNFQWKLGSWLRVWQLRSNLRVGTYRLGFEDKSWTSESAVKVGGQIFGLLL